MLAFRVPSYCCVVASSWGWGLFRLPSRVLFFPSRVPPSAFRCVAFRLLPSAFCLVCLASFCFVAFCRCGGRASASRASPLSGSSRRGVDGVLPRLFSSAFLFLLVTRTTQGNARRKRQTTTTRASTTPRLASSGPRASSFFLLSWCCSSRARSFFFFASPLRRLVPRRHEGLDKACSVWYTSWCGRGTASPPDTKGNTP